MTGAVMSSGGDFMVEGDPEQQQVVEASDSEFDKPESWFSVVWSSGKARVGLVILAIYILVAIFAPLIAPYSPTDGSFIPLDPASSDHLLGTNTSGQDIFSQLIYGSRVSLIVGLFGGVLATVIALIIGMISGYAEGTWLDDLLTFVTNVFLVIPTLPLIITLVAYSDIRGVPLIVGVIAITSWAGAARAKTLADHHAAKPRLRHGREIRRRRVVPDHLPGDHAQHDLVGRGQFRRCRDRRDRR